MVLQGSPNNCRALLHFRQTVYPFPLAARPRPQPAGVPGNHEYRPHNGSSGSASLSHSRRQTE